MSDPRVPPKVDPETLVLRASPRRAVRFKRGLLIGIAAVLCMLVFAATWLALRSSPFQKASPDNQYTIEHKPPADQLAELPATYAQIKPPKLGPPLPGDLGPPVTEAEHNLGVSATDQSFRPNAEVDAARAERMQLAQQARQASQSGVFFQIADKTAPAPATTQTNGPANQSTTNAALNLDPSHDPNDQGHKLDFVNRKTDDAIYNPHTLQEPVSPYVLQAGSIIAASLISGLNSDLPGLVIAQVTEDTYDSPSGRYLLIPRGSRLIGTYDSVVAFGQSRGLVVWQRIIMPDGSSIQIDNLPATDAAGYAGLKDEVDYHTWALLKGVALSTLLGISTQLTLNGQSDLVTAIRQSTQDSVNQAGQQITERNLGIQPTITVRPGWPLRVIVHKDLVLKPYTG